MLDIFKKRPFESGILKRESGEPASELLLQSRKIEDCSSVSAVITLENRSLPHSPCDNMPFWKPVVNIVNFMEGLGFLALPYAVKQGGIAVIVAFFLIPVCLWYTGKVLIECLYDEDEKQRRVKVKSTFKDLGEILEPKYEGNVVTALFNVELFSGFGFLPCYLRISHETRPTNGSRHSNRLDMHCRGRSFSNNVPQVLVSVLMSVLWYGAEHVDAWNVESILIWDSEGGGSRIGVPILIYAYDCNFILPWQLKRACVKSTNSPWLLLCHMSQVLWSKSLLPFLASFLWIQHISTYP